MVQLILGFLKIYTVLLHQLP